MIWSFIQSGVNGGTLSAPMVVALPSPATAGNLLIAAIAFRGGFGVTGNSWSFGAGWTVAQSLDQASNANIGGAVAWKQAASGDQSISMSWSGSSTGRLAGAVLEYSAGSVPSLDVSAENTADNFASVTSISTGTTPTASGINDLALAIYLLQNAQGWASGNSYTNSFSERLNYAQSTSNFPRIIIAENLAPSGASFESTISTSSTGSSAYAVMAAFTAAAAASGAPRILTAGSRILGPGAAGGVPRIVFGGNRRMGPGV